MFFNYLRAHDGVARTQTLVALGHSRYRIEQALRMGRLVRPRKGWIALPETDPALIFAAQHGLILSCATQARRLGLWTFENEPHHYAVPQAGSEIRPPGSTLHWRRPVVPRSPGILIDPVENVLNIVAHCFPLEEAVAVWDSALNKRLVDRALLARLPYRGAAKLVLREAHPTADSGLESYVRLRLKAQGIRAVPQAHLYGHAVDFRIGKYLVFQIDGGHHVGAQRTSDIEHDALLVLRGYTVIRVSYSMVIARWDEVLVGIKHAMAQGRHLERKPRDSTSD